MFPLRSMVPGTSRVASQGVGGTKNRMTAALLALFLGGFGIHQFYLGNSGKGVLYLILTLTIIGALVTAVLALIDFITYLTKSDEEFNQLYG